VSDKLPTGGSVAGYPQRARPGATARLKHGQVDHPRSVGFLHYKAGMAAHHGRPLRPAHHAPVGRPAPARPHRCGWHGQQARRPVLPCFGRGPVCVCSSPMHEPGQCADRPNIFPTFPTHTDRTLGRPRFCLLPALSNNPPRLEDCNSFHLIPSRQPTFS